MNLINFEQNQWELQALYEGLKEKCPIKYKDKIYYCGKGKHYKIWGNKNGKKNRHSIL